jgi:thioredoxin 1
VAILNLTKKTYQTTVEESHILVVDWWAPWCGACKNFASVFEQVAEAFPAVSFGKVNTEEESELVKANEIKNIPSLSLYREGILLFREPGYFDADALSDILTQASSIDMTAVRADIAKMASNGEQATSKQC